MNPVTAHFETWDGVVRSWNIPRTVYPPREDTHFLAKVLRDVAKGTEAHNILEIGVGSGAISMTLALEGHQVTGIDIHPEAVAVTQGLATELDLQANLNVFEEDIRELEFKQQYDIITWNAPYLDPVENENQALQWSDEVSLTACIEDHRILSTNIIQGEGLSRNGFLLLVLSREKTCYEIAQAYAADGWAMRPIDYSSHGGEHLVALCLWRPWPAKQTIELQETGSTNLVALEMSNLEPGDHVIAHNQTSGKGRKGREWISRPGDFTASWVLPVTPHFIERPQTTQLRAAIATMDALLRWLGQPSITFDPANAWHHDFGLKWPNDLMYQGRKCGGILIQGHQQGAVSKTVAGIGINFTVASEPWGSLHGLHPSGNSSELVEHLTAAIAHWFGTGPAGKPPHDREIIALAHRAMSTWGAGLPTPLSLKENGNKGESTHYTRPY